MHSFYSSFDEVFVMTFIKILWYPGYTYDCYNFKFLQTLKVLWPKQATVLKYIVINSPSWIIK